MTTPTTGDDYLLYIDTNSVGATPPDTGTRLWVLIAGQKSFSNPYSLGVADVTDKDSNNYEESIATNRSSEKSLEGLVEANDPGQIALRSACENRNIAYFKHVTPAGDLRIYQGLVTEYSEDAPQDDAVTFTATIKRTGSEATA